MGRSGEENGQAKTPAPPELQDSAQAYCLRWGRRFRLSKIFGVLALTAGALTAQEVSQSGLELKGPRPMVSQPERAAKAMIASANQIAYEAGLGILRKGGNAVDAAVAV